MASAATGSLSQDPSRHVAELNAKFDAAQSSWYDAEAAREVARQESEAVQKALEDLKHEPTNPSSPGSSSAVAAQEQRLRDQLNALEMARREAIQREAHEKHLRLEAQRLAREVEDRERESQVRLAQLETVEAQREAAAAQQSVLELENRSRHHYHSAPSQKETFAAPPQVPTQSLPPQPPKAPSADFYTSSSNPIGTAIMPGYSSGSAAESDTLLSMLELHKKLDETQAKLRAQVRLTFSLQDKLRQQEESLREAQSAEHRARSDCIRHTSRRKHEHESRTRVEDKLTKRAELAERRNAELEAKNEALREQLTSARAAQSSSERRAAIAEDDLGPISKGELRRAQYELAEEKRKCREQERSFNTMLAAEQKANAALKAEQAATHESRKVSLRIAQRAKTAAQEKLAFEKARAQQLEEELTKAHEEKVRKAVEARGRIASIEVASTFTSSARGKYMYGNSPPTSPAHSPPQVHAMPSAAATAAVAMTSAAMAELMAARSGDPHRAVGLARATAPPPPLPPSPRAPSPTQFTAPPRAHSPTQQYVAQPKAHRPASPRRPQASPLVSASVNGRVPQVQIHHPPARIEPPTRVEPSNRAREELGRASQRAQEALQSVPKPYVHHADVGSYAAADNATRLFDRPTAGYPGFLAAEKAKKATDEGIERLRQSLAGSTSRMADLFKAWDRDGSGKITNIEFRLAVKSLGMSAPDVACDAVFDSLLEDNSVGSIDFTLFVRRLTEDNLRRDIDRVMGYFKKLDANNSGGVSKAEFRRGIQSLGGFDDAPGHELDGIFDTIDLDRNGRIEFNELWKHFRKGDLEARFRLPR